MAPQSTETLRQDAVRIWRAGVEAVDSDRLVRSALRVDGSMLRIGDESLSLDRIGRIAVVGAGKAGAGMAAAAEDALGPRCLAEKHVAGWVNVPDDCVRELKYVWLHGARPAGVNEPTAAGEIGTGEILRMVEELGPDDLCLCLLSGGGSALLPAPVDSITLADKLAVTKHLSAAGATIEQLNLVRRHLSRVKGGGLARACKAGRLVSLIISDVLGDSLSVIASGPTVQDASTALQALAILEEFEAEEAGISKAVFDFLNREKWIEYADPACRVTNLIIGNNGLAVDAAAETARRLGYETSVEKATASEGIAEEVGHRLVKAAQEMRALGGKRALISGGEPVVRLAEASRRGRGGRNQQLVLAALTCVTDRHANDFALLSAGTDGEDGPTDAAGAVIDGNILRETARRNLDPADYLARNDAYHFFGPLGALLKTGPTHTNVCDVRVVLVDSTR
jgi:hydroxypyruvate reductase